MVFTENQKRIQEETIIGFIESKRGHVEHGWRYQNASTKIPVICEKEHRWGVLWGDLKRGTWCPECDNLIVHEETVKDLINAKNGKLDHNWKYKNNSTKFWVECRQGHRWEATWQNLKGRGSWCPSCVGKFVEEKTIRDFIGSKGGKVLDNWVYVSAKTKFNLECSEGHCFESCWDRIRAEHWCPDCRTTKTENAFREIMEQIFSVTFPKVKPAWLKNPATKRSLELDGYNPEKKIAFEYQGPLHYEEGWFTQSSLEKQKVRDDIKVRACFKNNVTLIVMPHWIPKRDWEIEITNQYNTLQEVLCLQIP